MFRTKPAQAIIIALAALGLIGFTAISAAGEGLHLEAGGVKLSLGLSADKGLDVRFTPAGQIL
jgi:hypothetical protein